MPQRISPALTRTAAAACLFFVAAAASAQSLEALYDAARAYDATYLAARAQADAAPYRHEQTRALMRPNVNLAANATRSNTDTPIGTVNNFNTGTQVAGSQPLFNRANGATIDQAERSLAVAMADLQLAEQDLIVRLAQAYFDVLGAQDTLATTRGNKAAISEQLASAKRNFEVGTATITDTREAQARFDLASAQEIAADNDLRNKRNALDTLVGRSGVEPAPLKLPAVLPGVSPDRADTWVDFATSAPNVRRAQLAFEIAQLETAKARAGHLPTVALVASVGRSHNTEGGAGSLPGSTNNAQVGVQLNLPLFAGYSVQNRVKETLALEERSRNDLEAVRRTVTLQTRQAFSSLQSGEAQVRALEAAEASNKLALEAIQLGYRVGVRVNLDVLNAQSQLFATQRDLAKARYDVLLNNLRLRQAAGVLKPADVSATSRLVSP